MFPECSLNVPLGQVRAHIECGSLDMARAAATRVRENFQCSLNFAECSLKLAKCSPELVKYSLTLAKCSLTSAECSLQALALAEEEEGSANQWDDELTAVGTHHGGGMSRPQVGQMCTPTTPCTPPPTPSKCLASLASCIVSIWSGSGHSGNI
jgi:hypothetical protein